MPSLVLLKKEDEENTSYGTRAPSSQYTQEFSSVFSCIYMTAGLYIMHFVSCRWGVQQTCHRHFCVCEQVSFGYHTYKRNCPISRWPSDPETGTSHCRQLSLNIYALSSFHYYWPTLFKSIRLYLLLLQASLRNFCPTLRKQRNCSRGR